MAEAEGRILDLPIEPDPSPNDWLAVDGVTTRRTRISDAARKGTVYATEAEARLGASETTVMNPLRVKQSIDEEVGTPGAAGKHMVGLAIVADIRNYLAAAPYVGSRTVLKGLDTVKETVAFLSEAGRAGHFIWNGSDLSSKIVGQSFTSSLIADVSDLVQLKTTTSTSVNSGTNTITTATHGWSNGDLVYTATSVNGLTTGRRYFIINATTNTYQLSLSPGGAAVSLTGATNFSIRREHGLATGTAVIVSASVNGLSTGQVYYVINFDARSFKLAASYADALAGTAVDFTAQVNFTTHVLTDPEEGVYVIPTGKALDGSQGAWVRVHDEGKVKSSWFGHTETTPVVRYAQAGADYLWWQGGGELEVGEGEFVHDATLNIWQTVLVRGVGVGYYNLYSSTLFRAFGTVFKLATGANVDLVVGRNRLRPGDPTPDHPDDVRHQGGIVGVVLWGNRSSNQSPLVRDNNTAGHGLSIQGCSNFHVDKVLLVRCAEKGLEMVSFDYGAGAISPNNMLWGSVQSLGNYEDGFQLVGGDQQFGILTAGYNGRYGAVSTAGNSSLVAFYGWNNFDRNLYHTGGDFFSVAVVKLYDGRAEGAMFSSCDNCMVDSYIIMRNGQDTGKPAAERAGLRFGAGVKNFVLGDGVISDDALFGSPTQTYGVYNGDATNTISVGTVRGEGNTIALASGIALPEAANTFTPSLQFGGVAVGMTYAARTGRYSVYGRMVFFEIEIQLSAKGSSTGNATITGLPVAAAASSMVPVSGQSGMASISGSMSAVVAAGTSATLWQQGTAGAVALTEANFSDTARVFIKGFYFT